MRNQERGALLIEALIGLGLLLGLAASIALLLGLSRRVTIDARHDTMCLWLARSKLDQLGSLTFASQALPSGGTVLLTDTVTDLTRDPPRVGGLGLTPSPPGALEADVAGYVDYADAAGRPVDVAVAGAGSAVYVRRWSVIRTGTGTGELATFEVIVATRTLASQVPPGRLVEHPGVVRLFGARVRRAG